MCKDDWLPYFPSDLTNVAVLYVKSERLYETTELYEMVSGLKQKVISA